MLGIEKFNRTSICPNSLSFLEPDAVFLEVVSVLSVIPFKLHMSIVCYRIYNVNCLAKADLSKLTLVLRGVGGCGREAEVRPEWPPLVDSRGKGRVPVKVQRVFSGAPWEKIAGYCRAFRVGSTIAVAGTTVVDENGGIHASGDLYAQSVRCLQIIERALRELGCDRRSVIRKRIFVTDISRAAEVMRAHGEYFAECPPAATLVQVSALVDPQVLVEIEADAVMAV